MGLSPTRAYWSEARVRKSWGRSPSSLSWTLCFCVLQNTTVCLADAAETGRRGEEGCMWQTRGLFLLCIILGCRTYVRYVESFPIFLPRCMECRRGLAMRILSVRLSVCPSNAWIVTNRKKNQSRLLYHTKEHLAQFYEKKNGWWRVTLLHEILGQRAGAKSPILNR